MAAKNKAGFMEWFAVGASKDHFGLFKMTRKSLKQGNSIPAGMGEGFRKAGGSGPGCRLTDLRYG